MANGPHIDEEIRRICRALTDEERRELRASLEAEGLRESLIVWQAENILLDGHHRLELCNELGITPRFKPAQDVEDRPSAIAWVHRCQLGRRNLNPEEMAYHRGKLYEAQKADAHSRPQAEEPGVQNVHRAKTSERLADEFGVSELTIRRDAAFARAVDSIERNVGPEVAQSIRAGTSKLTRAQVTEIGAMDAEQQPDAFNTATACQQTKSTGGQGPTLPIPSELSPEGAYRRTVELERAGYSLHEAMKEVGLSEGAHAKIRRIVTLADRDDLPSKDRQIVDEALALLNDRRQVQRPAAMVEPIAHRIWGRYAHHGHDQAEARRQRAFDKAVHVMIHSCVVAKDIEIPHLGPDRSKEVLAELDEAIAGRRAFRRKIVELSR